MIGNFKLATPNVSWEGPPDRLELNPKDAATLAEEMFKAGQFGDAFAVFEALSETNPKDWEVAHHAGYCLLAQRKYKESLPWFDRAASIAVSALNQITLNKSEALGEAGRSEEAIHMLRHGILRQYPDHAKALYNLGVLLMQTQKFEEALTCFERVSKLDSECAGGNWRYCEGFAHLVLGDYIKGFAGFRERMREENGVGLAQGTELRHWHRNISGATVLVLNCTGRGDVIQFGRYVPMLVDRGANVSIIADRGLEALFVGMEGVTIYAETDILPASDYWTHIMDLANVFETTVDTVPAPLQLTYDVELLKKWAHAIPDVGVLNVGLCWAGNPESRYDEHRTIPLEMLRPLIDLQYAHKVRFFSLHLDIRDGDWTAYDSMDMAPIGERFTNYRETAHAMKCLDLVITVDTSVAHMAGTVGVPTWILTTRFRTYWLWLKGRNDTPWYPSVELIRQPLDGDWPSAVAVAREKLLGLLASR